MPGSTYDEAGSSARLLSTGLDRGFLDVVHGAASDGQREIQRGVCKLTSLMSTLRLWRKAGPSQPFSVSWPRTTSTRKSGAIGRVCNRGFWLRM
jgi:hypothetical protein